jgi:hypothetical protein
MLADCMARSIPITVPGRYLTQDRRLALIVRIDGGRAYGRIPGYYDRTWWYTNGEHAICPIDDLMGLADPDADGTQPLSIRENTTMKEFKAMVANGGSIGRRAPGEMLALRQRLTTMLALERVGLVQRVMINGRIADWRLTSAGEEWQG